LQKKKHRMLAKTTSRAALELFGIKIFDWRVTTSRTELLGGTSPLERLAIDPYCTSLLASPVLRWATPENVDEVEIEISKIEEAGPSCRSIWHDRVPNTGHLAHADFGPMLDDSSMY